MKSKKIRIGLISTVNTNIGDDLIREGIRLIMQQIFKGQNIKYFVVNKHIPMSVYPFWHPVRWTELLPKGRIRVGSLLGRLFHYFGASYFDHCNIVVQCGTPVFWPGCHHAEWAEILWYQVVGRLHRKIPVINIAAGSCYPWERQPDKITDPYDTKYLSTILDFCRLTTVRDKLAQKLCKSLGWEVPLIPCAALLANKYKDNKMKDNVVIINYMLGGGHYDWGQGIDSSRWYQTMKEIVVRLKKRHKLIFLSHNKIEYDLALKLDSTIPRIWPKTIQEYFKIVPRAKAAICNRMHASVALASMGIPSIAVGTDTRLLMVEALELPHLYVKEVDSDILENMIEEQIKNSNHERERLCALKTETLDKYIRIIGEFLFNEL